MVIYRPSGASETTGPATLLPIRFPLEGYRHFCLGASVQPTSADDMTDPLHAITDLGVRIHRHEARGSHDPSALAAALEQACRKLEDELTNLVGSRGVSALIGRALHLARREHPLLGGVALAAEIPVRFTGLSESLGAAPAEEAAAAGAAVLTHLLRLLVTLLGEDLGLRPVHELWPHHVLGSAAPSFTESEA